MAGLIYKNIKGSTLIESLVAISIITLIFTIAISFFTTTNTKKRIDNFCNLMELKNEIASENQAFSILGDEKIKKEEFVFQDSVCLIQKITLKEEEKQEQSFLKIIPIKKK